MSLSSTICNIKLDSCIMNASGCWCTTESELDDLNNSCAGAVVSKSGTINPRTGNPSPRLFVDSYGSVNSMGLPNLGYKFYTEYGKKVTEKHFIQSIHPFSLEELDTMLYDINASSTTQRLVEVNITCPNLLSASGENSFENFEKYMDRINQSNLPNITCGLKLSPFFELNHFDVMSNLLLKHNIKFITCINSLVNGLIVDPISEITRIHPKAGLGGIGGVYCKPIALSNVYNFSKRLNDKVDIIGCGGVSRGFDVFEYILCGAKAVQIGTHLVRNNPKCFHQIENELKYIMELKKYSCLDDFYKKIKVVDAL